MCRDSPRSRLALIVLTATIVVVSAASTTAQERTPLVVRPGVAPDCRAFGADPALARSVPWLVGRGESPAAARFMAGDVHGALEAWNRVEEPRIRCVNVEGAVRTPRAVVIDYLDPSAGDVLTSGSFARMARRLDELPIASRTRLRFDPDSRGSATVTPIIAERELVPQGVQSWGVIGVRSLFLQEVRIDVAGPTGRGEMLSPSYRWDRHRPRAMLRLDAPAPGVLPGVVRLRAFVESQTYRYAELGTDVFRQPRQRIGAAMSDWFTGWLRWDGGVAFDRIESSGYLALEGSLNVRAFDDRAAVILTTGRWTGGAASFTSTELVAAVRSTTHEDVPQLTMVAGVAGASDTAPLALWPTVSSGEGRNGLLRAHPLRRDGVIQGEVFGRRLGFASTEFEYPVQTRVGPVGVAAFIDVARAARRLDRTASPLHVDVGAGIRFSGSNTGKVRLDLGYGIRDNGVRVSAGFVAPWGTR